MFKVEITDTFCGQANYAWVERHTLDLPADASAYRVTRAVKRLALLSGIRTATYDDGTCIEVKPIGRNAPCVVAFASWED